METQIFANRLGESLSPLELGAPVRLATSEENVNHFIEEKTLMGVAMRSPTHAG
jgi:hypothetical protein